MRLKQLSIGARQARQQLVGGHLPSFGASNAPRDRDDGLFDVWPRCPEPSINPYCVCSKSDDRQLKVGSQSDGEPMPRCQRRRSIAFTQSGGSSAFKRKRMVPYRSSFWKRATAGNVSFRRPKMYPDFVALIVEDEPLLRYSVAYALRSDGCLILGRAAASKRSPISRAVGKLTSCSRTSLGGLLERLGRSGCLQTSPLHRPRGQPRRPRA
jgi:hypothetical protein